MMASDVSMRYRLDYRVTYDIDVAKDFLRREWNEADDEDEFMEFIEDDIIASLEEYESLKAQGLKLPPHVTHFSLVEESVRL